MRHLNIILVSFAALSLAGCGTLATGATQKVTLLTPGAYDAQCILDNGVGYRVRTGEVTNIMRSHHDLKVDCYAPGNRHQSLVVPNDFNDWAALDLFTGIIPGGVYDHFAGGLYEYPFTVTVDFVGVPTRGFELPEYHNKDALSPYKQSIEDYGPTTAKVPSDSTYLRRGVVKRDGTVNSNPFSTAPAAGADITPMPASTGGASTTTTTTTTTTTAVPTGKDAESLTRSANPAVFNK